MTGLTDKVALVTGGSRGMGAALAGCWIASDESRFMTGAGLTIDGGTNA